MANVAAEIAVVEERRARMVEDQYGKNAMTFAYDGITEVLLSILLELRELNENGFGATERSAQPQERP